MILFILKIIQCLVCTYFYPTNFAYPWISGPFYSNNTYSRYLSNYKCDISVNSIGVSVHQYLSIHVIRMQLLERDLIGLIEMCPLTPCTHFEVTGVKRLLF